MKKLIALFTALVLCITLLPGCGSPTASKRRKAAMNLFDITADEYARNQEYYDALMDIYGNAKEGANADKDAPVSSAEQDNGPEPDYETDAWADTWTDGQSDDDYPEEFAESDDPAVALRGQEAFDLWTLSYYFENADTDMVVAVKKGDTFYTPELLDGKKCYIGNKESKYVMGRGEDWSWPDVSLSAGDQIVVFVRKLATTSGDSHDFILAPISDRVECLPIVFRRKVTGSGGSIRAYLDRRASDNFNVEGWKNIILDSIEGVPAEESPKLLEVNVYYGALGDNHDYVIVGEPGEEIELGGLTDDYYPQPVSFHYPVEYSALRVPKRAMYGWDSDSKETALVDDNGVASVPEYHIRPTDEGYYIVFAADTKRPPAGYYLFEGYPIHIVD